MIAGSLGGTFIGEFGDADFLLPSGGKSRNEKILKLCSRPVGSAIPAGSLKGGGDPFAGTRGPRARGC